MPRPFRLATDGDDLERWCWVEFIERDFPAYEVFWYCFTTPLTERVRDRTKIRFLAEAPTYGVYLAQLNYSVVWHLSAVHAMRAVAAVSGWDSQRFVNTVVRTCSALDAADEFLNTARSQPASDEDLWHHKKQRQRRDDWRNADVDKQGFFEQLRWYRNQLVHSGPFMHWEEGPVFPKVGRHDDYRDWRTATSRMTIEQYREDFAHASAIVGDAWHRALSYLNDAWWELLRERNVEGTVLPAMSPVIRTMPQPKFGTTVRSTEPAFPRGPMVFWDEAALAQTEFSGNSSSMSISRGFAVDMDIVNVGDDEREPETD